MSQFNIQSNPPFACPECLLALKPAQEGYRCDRCSSAFHIKDEIPMLCKTTDFYYGEVPRPEMLRIIDEARNSDWRKAVANSVERTGKRYFQSYVMGSGRSAAKFLLDHFHTGTVLDYGCGVGSLTVSLARNYRQVLATDLCFERAAFTAARVEQEGFANVSVFCSGDTTHIPLPDGAVDVIVLNGVLEWVPEARQGNPRLVQVAFLRELRRLLKPDGMLYVAIENRSGYGYLMGRKEDHTGLRFGAVLPRKLSDLYSRIVRKKPYRTYTYTRSGYKRLFENAGFGSSKFFGILPDYRDARTIVDVSDRKMIWKSLNFGSLKARLKGKVAAPLFPYITHSYGILAATRQEPANSYYSELAEHVARQLNLGDFKIERYFRSKETATVHVWLVGGKGQEVLVKLPLTGEMEQRGRRSLKALKDVLPKLKPELAAKLPKVLLNESFKGQYYWAEEAITAKGALETGTQFWYLLPSASEFLVEMARVTKRNAGNWSGLLEERCNSAIARMKDGRFSKTLNITELQATAMATIDSLKDLPHRAFTCAVHGDFWHGNLLVDATSVRGILDWDRYEADGLPMVDLYTLLATHLQRAEQSANPYQKLFAELNKGSKYANAVSSYAGPLDLDDRLIMPLLFYSWLERLLNLQSMLYLPSTPHEFSHAGETIATFRASLHQQTA